MKRIVVAVLLFWSVAFAQTVPIKNIDPKVSQISKQEVFWIYTLRTRFWNDGTRIIVYYQDFNSSAHYDFCRNVLQVSPLSFQSAVETYVNVGNAAYFRKASSDAEVLKLVARTPGSVGYISENFLVVNEDNHVRKIGISN